MDNPHAKMTSWPPTWSGGCQVKYCSCSDGGHWLWQTNLGIAPSSHTVTKTGRLPTGCIAHSKVSKLIAIWLGEGRQLAGSRQRSGRFFAIETIFQVGAYLLKPRSPHSTYLPP